MQYQTDEEYQLRDHHQISLLIVREFKQINKLLSPLKSSENQVFRWFHGE